MRYKYAFLFSLVLGASAAMATSYSGPVKQTVYSCNGGYYAVLDPAKEEQYVYKKDKNVKAVWSFSFRPEMDTWLVPDNGEFVACIRWRFVRLEDLDRPAIIIFRKDGTRAEYSYNSLGKARRTGLFETAPKGSFWRVWYEELKMENNRVEIFTHDERRITLSGDDGRVDVWRD